MLQHTGTPPRCCAGGCRRGTHKHASGTYVCAGGGVSLGTARVRQGRESTVERCAPPCAGSGWHARRKATGVRAYGPGRVGIACLLSGGLRRPSRRRKCPPHSQRGRAHRDDGHLHDASGGRALARATFRPQLGTWRGGAPECQALAAANASRTRRVRDASVSRAVLSPPLLREACRVGTFFTRPGFLGFHR